MSRRAHRVSDAPTVRSGAPLDLAMSPSTGFGITIGRHPIRRDRRPKTSQELGTPTVETFVLVVPPETTQTPSSQ